MSGKDRKVTKLVEISTAMSVHVSLFQLADHL